jgi:hypothetical protein
MTTCLDTGVVADVVVDVVGVVGVVDVEGAVVAVASSVSDALVATMCTEPV